MSNKTPPTEVRMVPVEPTIEMIAAGDRASNLAMWNEDIVKIYRAMLAAAPDQGDGSLSARKDAPEQAVAWMRKWAFDGEKPEKHKKPNGRWAWPTKFKFQPVSQTNCLPDDIPLYAHPPRLDAQTVEHQWAEPNAVVKWPHCAVCGIIKRSDGKNSPCKGKVGIALRLLRDE